MTNCVTAHILQPNCPMIPNVDYSFDMENLNSLDEFKQGIYKYLRFDEKNITDEIEGVQILIIHKLIII